MVHTLPDYSTKYKMTKVFGQIDTGELAARLGSPDTFDRRGNIVWMDDFESPTLKWAEDIEGIGSSMEYSADRCFTGSTSMKMTTGAVDGNLMGMLKKFIPPSNTKIGLEARVFCETANTYVFVTLFGRAVDHLYWGRVRWSFTDRTFSYERFGGGYTNLKIDTFNDTDEETWVPIKLVIDYGTLKYVRAIFGDEEYDLSGLNLRVEALPGVASMQISVSVEAAAAAASIIYVDNVIFTQSEP